MAASSTTRRSTNPGHPKGIGGPAKGAAVDRQEQAPEFVAGNKMHMLPKNERKAAREEAAWRMRETALDDPDWRCRAYAADTILGKAKQGIEMSGVDGDAIKQDLNIAVVFRKPSE